VSDSTAKTISKDELPFAPRFGANERAEALSSNFFYILHFELYILILIILCFWNTKMLLINALLKHEKHRRK